MISVTTYTFSFIYICTRGLAYPPLVVQPPTRGRKSVRETEARALRQLAIMKVWAQICWATEKPAKGIPVNWLHNKKLCCRLMLISNAFSNAACLFVRACALRRGNVYYWCNEVKREGSAVQCGDIIWLLFCFHLFTVSPLKSWLRKIGITVMQS